MSNKTTASGAVGGAIGVLTVMFMPTETYVFTPETAAHATAAVGTIFAYLIRYLPAPPRRET